MKYFKNPANDYIEKYNPVTAPLWCFLFGFLYWTVRGNAKHTILSFLLTLMTFGVSGFVYPFLANGINVRNYYQNGWQQVNALNKRDASNNLILNENPSVSQKSSFTSVIFVIVGLAILVLVVLLIKKSTDTIDTATENNIEQVISGLLDPQLPYPANLQNVIQLSDWPIIQQSLGFAFSMGESKTPMKWHNQETGAQGTLIQSGTGVDDAGCRQFKITKDNKSEYVDVCPGGLYK